MNNQNYEQFINKAVMNVAKDKVRDTDFVKSRYQMNRLYSIAFNTNDEM